MPGSRSARACGPAATLAAGVQEIRALPGAFSVDLLALSSPAPAGLPPVAGGGGVVTSAGERRHQLADRGRGSG